MVSQKWEVVLPVPHHPTERYPRARAESWTHHVGLLGVAFCSHGSHFLVGHFKYNLLSGWIIRLLECLTAWVQVPRFIGVVSDSRCSKPDAFARYWQTGYWGSGQPWFVVFATSFGVNTPVANFKWLTWKLFEYLTIGFQETVEAGTSIPLTLRPMEWDAGWDWGCSDPMGSNAWVELQHGEVAYLSTHSPQVLTSFLSKMNIRGHFEQLCSLYHIKWLVTQPGAS